MLHSNAILYLIPGLGADEKVFKHYHFHTYTTQVILWDQPEKEDTIKSYSLKLSKQINTQKDIVLIGVSMGGIIAKELKLILKVKACILISTIQCSYQFNPIIKLGRWIPLQKWIPVRLLKFMNLLTANYYFSVSNPAQKKALRKTIEGTDLLFLKWSLHALVSWKNEIPDEQILHIIGDSDRIFPIKYIETPKTIIKGAGHWMVVEKAKEIESIILNYLNQIE